MDTTLTIKLSDRLSGQELTRETAIPLRMEIEGHWTTYAKVILDFSDLGFASISFLDELVGKLFSIFDKKDVMQKVLVINLDREDRILLGNIANSRIKQRQSPLEEV